MRTLALLLALLVAHGALADESGPPPPSPMRAPEASIAPFRLDARDLVPIERRARYRRNVGIGLAVPGVALVVIGAVLIGAGARDSRLVAGAAEIAGGAVSAGVGVVFTVPGALLWIGGQDDLDLVAWRRRRLTPQSAGASVTIGD